MQKFSTSVTATVSNGIEIETKANESLIMEFSSISNWSEHIW